MTLSTLHASSLVACAHGTAHGKLILIGEHAVVYQQPAIALPFQSTTVSVHISECSQGGTISCDYFTGPIHQCASLAPIATLLEQLCDTLGLVLSTLYIQITSTIPTAKGMGSSAAVACAIVRALYQWVDVDIPHTTLMTWINVSEQLAHGSPSGIDAYVTATDMPVLYTKGYTPTPLTITLPGYLVVGDTGVKGSTKEAVASVQHLMKHRSTTQHLIQHMGYLTHQAAQALVSTNRAALGQVLTTAHHTLQQLNVSHPALDHLVTTALKAGALGAKLTGGGLGGCMIALVSCQEQAQYVACALSDAGAKDTWIYPLGGNAHDAI